MEYLTLNNAVKIPQVGLGTWKAKGKACYQAVQYALAEGYRLVDTAKIYGNEKQVGRAIRDSNVPRDEIFLTTKLWKDDVKKLRVARGYQRSLQRLQVDRVDLLLIHWPVGPEHVEAWARMEDLYHADEIRAIGVSNFMIEHLEPLLAETSVVPAVNQVEVTPFQPLTDLQAYCEDHDIQMEAYSPLTRGEQLNHPTLVEIAEKHGKNPAQVLLRWDVQQGLVTIPKSTDETHLTENLALWDFELDPEDMEALGALAAQ